VGLGDDVKRWDKMGQASPKISKNNGFDMLTSFFGGYIY